MLEYPEDAGKTLGLDQYNIDGQSASKANTVAGDQAATMLEAAQKINGVNILAQPSVSLESGRMAEVQVVDMHQIPSGRKILDRPGDGFHPDHFSGRPVGSNGHCLPFELSHFNRNSPISAELTLAATLLIHTTRLVPPQLPLKNLCRIWRSVVM